MPESTSASIRRIIVRLFKQERPPFGVIKHLEGALKESLALERALSVDDLPTTRADMLITHGNTVTLGGNSGYGDSGMDEQTYPIQERRQRRREASLVDQALSAMDQAVARSGGHDGLAAILQSVPNLDLIYRNDREREAVLAALRSEINHRLSDRLPPAEPVPEPPELPALTDREAS